MSFGTDCFGVAVAFDFVSAFNAVPLLTLPIVQDRKWIKKVLLSEPKASFNTFPFFVLHNWAPEGQWQRGRLSFAVFSLAKQRKDSSCRSTTDLQNADQAQKRIRSKNNQSYQNQNDTPSPP